MSHLSATDLQQRVKGGEAISELVLDGLDLRNCDLSGGIFQEVSLNGADLRGANLHEAVFTECELNDVQADGAQLAQTGKDRQQRFDALVSSPVSGDLVLVASELATNGIKHGRPPTIVELRQDGQDFLLTVADHDLGSEPRIAGERPPGEGGFGLQIARRLARDVGWYRTDTVKVIWAALGP